MSADWLSTGISELLNSPHISFPKPPTGIRLGPGPIDLFSTKFNNLFALGVEAKVDGEEVSRDDLKQKLLNLQKHWKPEQVKFQQETLPAPDLGTVAIISPHESVCFLAETKQEGGRRMIKKFAMNGAASLFL